MQRMLALKVNRDGTMTVRATRASRADAYIEHIGIEGKTPYEVFDAVKWSLITAGFHMDEDEIADLVRSTMVE